MIPPIDRGAPALDPVGTMQQPAELFRSSLARADSQQGPPIMQQYTDRSLYAPGGPRPEDVAQGAFGDCGYLAALSAIARQQPQLIRNQITYDDRTGNFQVTLYRDPDPKNPDNPHQWVTIQVTQDDIRNNITRGGGSTVDNNGYGPIWPSVMETARAKMLDGNPADGLDKGYKALADYPGKGMEAVTGRSAGDMSMRPMVLDDQTRGLLSNTGYLTGPGIGNHLWADHQYNQVRSALGGGRPVTLTTTPENRKDGLVENHVYQVENIKRDTSGNIEITLRNPWGQNDVGEVPSNGPNPVVTAKPETSGFALSYFTIGPSPQETGVG